MTRLLLIFLLILAACQGSGTSETNKQVGAIDVSEVFMYAFNAPECINPCWLGIEIEVTNRENAIAVLEEHNIEFTLEGYGGGVIHFHHIPDGLVPGMDPEGSHPGNVYGDMNVGERNSDTVQSIDFFLDLCVSTVVDAYGVPGVWSTQKGIPTTLVYPDRRMFFSVDPATRRIDWVILHMADAMPPHEELKAWSDYADVFSEKCSDVFTAS